MHRALAVLFVAFIWGCSGGGDEPRGTETATGEDQPATATTRSVAPVEHWITIEDGRFIDRRTGDEFVPRGVNLLRKFGGGGDKLFERYDADWVEAQLAGIAGLGFNTVRVFVDMCMECTSTSAGIRDEFFADLSDLVSRAANHGLVVLLTSNDVPDPGYSDRLPCCEPFGGYRNSLYLSPEGPAIAAEYFSDLVTGLQRHGAPLEAVFAWQLANEQFILRDVNPIPMASGTVTAADGNDYDLADDAAVAEMVDGSLLAYIDHVAGAIRELDPGGLVTMGFFAPEQPGAGRTANDNRWVVPASLLQDSALDFVDLHAYPGLGGRWDELAAAFGLEGEPAKPVILGEFGAFSQAWRAERLPPR